MNQPSKPASGALVETVRVAGAQAGVELNGVVRSYLGSRGYNGVPLGRVPAGWDVDRLRTLVLDGLVQVVTDDDYPNMHIRPGRAGDHARTKPQASRLRSTAQSPAACTRRHKR